MYCSVCNKDVSPKCFHSTPAELSRDIESLEKELKAKKSALENAYRTCIHQWGETKYEPICTEGYTIPGDEPGTRGVDWRGPCYVPPKTTRRWKRSCIKCGFTKYTENTEKQTVSGQIPGTNSEIEVPKFYGNCN